MTFEERRLLQESYRRPFKRLYTACETLDPQNGRAGLPIHITTGVRCVRPPKPDNDP